MERMFPVHISPLKYTIFFKINLDDNITLRFHIQ